MVRDGENSVTWYRDGRQVGQVTSLNEQVDEQPDGVWIGSDQNAEWFKGLIDEVKVWNYALTVEQVKMEYGGGAVKFGQ